MQIENSKNTAVGAEEAPYILSTATQIKKRNSSLLSCRLPSHSIEPYYGGPVIYRFAEQGW